MSIEGTAFPGSGSKDGRSEMWKEYVEIKREATDQEAEALRAMEAGKPRDAQVHATIGLCGRLEALTYLISKMRSF